jgi:thioredoxin-related protein
VKRIALALTFFLAASAEAGSQWHKTVAAAQKEAKQKNQLIFIDMFADWCGWCHRMEKEVFPAEAFQKASEDMVLLRLNTEDNGEGTQLSQALGVRQLPTFVIVTKDLTIAGVITGYAPADRFAAEMNKQRFNYKEFLKNVEAEPKLPLPRRVDIADELVRRQNYLVAEQKLTKILGEKSLAAELRNRARHLLALSQLGQKKFDVSLKTVDGIIKGNTGKPAEEAKFLKAQIYLEQGNLASALAELKSFKTSYPNSPLIGNVNRLVPQVEYMLKPKK